MSQQLEFKFSYDGKKVKSRASAQPIRTTRSHRQFDDLFAGSMIGSLRGHSTQNNISREFVSTSNPAQSITSHI